MVGILENLSNLANIRLSSAIGDAVRQTELRGSEHYGTRWFVFYQVAPQEFSTIFMIELSSVIGRVRIYQNCPFDAGLLAQKSYLLLPESFIEISNT